MRIYFVVMRNFVPVSPHLVFDLKGATANRRALASSKLLRLGPAAPERGWPEASSVHAPGADSGVAAPRRQRPKHHSRYATLRDWEWLDVAMRVELPEEDVCRVHAQLAADTALLAHLRIIDYSLIVAVARVEDVAAADEAAVPAAAAPAVASPGTASRSSPRPEAKARALRRMQALGGLVSRDRQKAYFVGIIDALSLHTVGWVLQAQLLRALYTAACRPRSAEGITALPPNAYAERFLAFMRTEVFAPPPRPGCGPAGPGPGEDAVSRRWVHLWARRRHGLIRERIESERTDLTARIAELEAEVQRMAEALEPGAGAARGPSLSDAGPQAPVRGVRGLFSSAAGMWTAE